MKTVETNSFVTLHDVDVHVAITEYLERHYPDLAERIGSAPEFRIYIGSRKIRPTIDSGDDYHAGTVAWENKKHYKRVTFNAKAK